MASPFQCHRTKGTTALLESLLCFVSVKPLSWSFSQPSHVSCSSPSPVSMCSLSRICAGVPSLWFTSCIPQPHTPATCQDALLSLTVLDQGQSSFTAICVRGEEETSQSTKRRHLTDEGLPNSICPSVLLDLTHNATREQKLSAVDIPSPSREESTHS